MTFKTSRVVGDPGHVAEHNALAANLNANGSSFTSITDGNSLRRLSNTTAIDRLLSHARQRVRYDDATHFVESWADKTAWSTQTGLQVSGGALFDSGAGGGMNHAFPIADTTGRARYKFKFVLPAAGGTGGIVVAGISKDTAGGTFAGGSTFWGLGFNTNNLPIWFDAENGIQSMQADFSVVAVAAGTYYATIEVNDAGYITGTIHSSDQFGEIRTGNRTRASFTGINNVAVFNSDSRALTGISIGKLGAVTDQVSIKPRSGVEDLSASASTFPLTSAGGDRMRLALPINYDSRTPTPLVVYCHGSTGNELSSITANQGLLTDAALRANGYAVLSQNLHGDNWGNQQALTDILNGYRYARDHYNIGPILLLGHSMGGLVVLNLLAHRVFPEVVCAYLIEPATDLASLFTTNPTFTALIKTAYGIAADGSDYATKTAGFDPNLRSGWEFRGIPMRFVSSAGDTTVPKAIHTDVMRAKVTPYAPEASLYVATGGHADASEFVPTDVTTFFNTYLAA